jgi:hypothetical protein
MMGAAGSFVGGLFGEPELDDATLADRAQASTELSAKFKIVQNDSEADGNAVTQEQFDEIVAMYSDIRMGKTNIEIGTGMSGDALEAFQDATMEDLARMMQTKSGRALIEDTMHAEDKDGNALKTRITAAKDPDEPATAADHDRHAMHGRGSSATIEYGAGEWVDAEREGGSWGDGWRSDVVLYHEMAHAKHMRDGKLGHSHDIEERNTVGMGQDFDPAYWQYFENRYRHERRMIGHGENGGVIEGDEGMGQRDNFKGDEHGGDDYETPYRYAGEDEGRRGTR